jgi:hypothetical protein
MLQHVSVELIDGTEHGVDVGPASTASLGTHRGRQSDTERQYFLLGIGDEPARLGPDIAQQLGGSWSS